MWGGGRGGGHAAELLEREGCTVGGGEGSSALAGRRARAGGGRAALKELELAERKEGNAAPGGGKGGAVRATAAPGRAGLQQGAGGGG